MTIHTIIVFVQVQARRYIMSDIDSAVVEFTPLCLFVQTFTNNTNATHKHEYLYLFLYIDQVSWLLQASVVDWCSNSDAMLQRLPLERGVKYNIVLYATRDTRILQSVRIARFSNTVNAAVVYITIIKYIMIDEFLE